MRFEEIKKLTEVCKKLKINTITEIKDYVIEKRESGIAIDPIFNKVCTLGGGSWMN